MPRPRKYPQELIDRGVRLAIESGRPVAHVAQDIGLPSETLRKAVRRAEADQGLRPDLPTTQEREEIKALKREVSELRQANEILRAASVFFAKELDGGQDEVSRFIDENRARFGVELICRTLEVSASAYYQRKSGERSARRINDERLTGQIAEIHRANYECYGQRRMHAALIRAGESAGRDRVGRLMRQAGLRGAKRRGKPWRTTTADPGAQRPADLVGRDFTAPAPDRLYVCDFTYLRCWEGRVYFSFVIDVFSRRVVGWQLAGHMRTTLVLDALRMALGTRAHGADVQLVHHSDAGSQYTSHDYQQELSDARVLASVGTVGDAYDNAMAESFVDSFKTELIADRVWRTRSQLKLAVVEYVAWFNTGRLHSSLGYRPPAEVEADRHAQNDALNALGQVYDPSGVVSIYGVDQAD